MGDIVTIQVKFNITIQPTNNKNIVKFVTDSFLTQAQSYEFGSIDEAAPSPIAQQLFYLPFVKTVYISQNFIAIEKYNIVEWEDVQDQDIPEEYQNMANCRCMVLQAVKKSHKGKNPGDYLEFANDGEVINFLNKTLC